MIIRERRIGLTFLQHFFVCIGVFAVVLQVLDFFVDKFPRGNVWITSTVLAVSFFYGCWRTIPRRLEIRLEAPNVTISITKGNILERQGNIAVGMTDTFDTETPIIIAEESLQGQVLHRLYSDDRALLDNDLARSLPKIPLESVAKAGKTHRYPLGTVATVRRGKRTLYCVAYCKMSQQNTAHSSPEVLWTSLASLWRTVSDHSNGGVIHVPVIGGGQSRISHVLPAMDSIRLIILSFVLASREEKVCNGLEIVASPDVFARLQKNDLAQFLKSL